MSVTPEAKPWQDEETHEKLMHAFREYFKANQEWHTKQTRRAGEHTRYWLAQIRIIAKDRRVKIQEFRHWLDKDKAERKANQKSSWKHERRHNLLMSWYYQDQLIEELPEDCLGFVYIITNLTNQRKYIGKKLAKFSKTTQKTVKLKNGTKKKKKIRSKIESDWRDYYGSSPNLTEDLNKIGASNFRREILYYCTSKAEMSYLEAREQFERRVLETDDYYNGIINLRVGGSPSLRQALLERQAKSSV